MSSAYETLIKQVELLSATGQFETAGALCSTLLEKFPDNIELLFLFGNCLAACNDLGGAASCFSRACLIEPGKPVLWKNLAIVRQQLGDASLAREAFEHALALDSENASLWISLASLHVADYAFDKAASCYRRALMLKPDDSAEILNRLATVQVYLGETSKALATFEQAIAQATVFEQKSLYTQNRLFSLHYPYGIEAENIAQAHRSWAAEFCNSLQNIFSFNNPARPFKRLKIGYVSPDFRLNAVCFFIQPVLLNHDTSQFDVFCYGNVKKPDTMTRRLQEEMPVTWRDIAALDDTQAHSLIRQDEIDILVDLTGHGGDNRLPLFARRPAPVQATWIGYPDTTGLSSIDYRITDAFADPPGMTEHLHSEQLLRLPGCFLSYNPGAEFPAVSPLPAASNHVITFGSMSNFSKITPELVAVWARIMIMVPDSRLVLRYRGQERTRIAYELGRMLEQAGVPSCRLELLGHASSVIEQLAGYHQIDIALDSFPYNGTTTTCEALWMGVPVVTLAGRTHVSRVGASLLTAIGLPQFITETPQQYIENAVSLAMNRPLLEALRSRLRQLVRSSPLCDHLQFTRQVESAYRTIWVDWCAKQNTGGQM